MLSDPEKARRFLLKEAEEHFCWQFMSDFGIKSHISVATVLECLIISQQNSNKFMTPDNHREAEGVETSCHNYWYFWQNSMNTWGWEDRPENTQDIPAKAILRQERKIEYWHPLINAWRQPLSPTQLQHPPSIHYKLGFTSPEVPFVKNRNRTKVQLLYCKKPLQLKLLSNEFKVAPSEINLMNICLSWEVCIRAVQTVVSKVSLAFSLAWAKSTNWTIHENKWAFEFKKIDLLW